MLLVHLALPGIEHVPDTLLSACGFRPGLACRVVWDLSHDAQAASWTDAFLAGPVHLLLQVVYVALLALVIRALVHRLINRLTERAEQSLLPQLRNGVRNGVRNGAAVSRLVPVRLSRRRHGRHGGGKTAEAAVPAEGGGQEGQGDNEEVNIAAARTERGLVDERRKQRVRALGAILRNAASVTIFTIAGVVILGDLGINLAPLLASAGVVGIAIGFGAQNLVRDYLSGVFMLVEDQYGVGDVITVGTATGTVEDVTLRVTRMRDVNGVVWHIRNGTIEQVGNESQGWARAVIDFPVPYATDLGRIRSVLAEVAAAFWADADWRGLMLEEPEVWGAQELTSAEVTMRIVVKTAPLRQWEVEREMRTRVKAALDAAGISPAA